MGESYVPWQTTPVHGESAIFGSIPAAWMGVELPDGDRDYWLQAPVGALYLYKPNETTQPKVFIKRQNEERDDDWGMLGSVHCIQQRVSYADFTDGGGATGTLVLNEQIPVGAWVLRCVLEDLDEFTGESTLTIQVGDGTDVDRYNTGTPSIATAATAVDLGAPSGTQIHTAAKSITITLTEDDDFTDITAGEFTFKLFYLK